MRIVVSITLLLCSATCYGPLRAIAATPPQQRTETAEKMFVQTLRKVRAAKKALEDSAQVLGGDAAVGGCVVDEVLRILNGGLPVSFCNPEVEARYRARFPA